MFLFGRRVGKLVGEQVLEPQRVAGEFIDAAGRGELARMRELSDPDSISRAELERFVEFIRDYCGTIKGKDFRGYNILTSDRGGTYEIQLRVVCSRTDFDATVRLRTRGSSGPIVTFVNWKTV